MSLSKFNGKVVLGATNLADISAGAKTSWNATFSFSDNSGAYLGSQVAVGDIIALDTGGVDIGTITVYAIASVVTSTFNSFRVTMTYLASNANPAGAPDVSAAVGIPGLVSRRSTIRSFATLPTPAIQQLPEAFAYQLSNNNVFDIIDSMGGTATALAGGSAGTVPYQSASGITAFTAAGTAGQFLTSAGLSSAPTWTTPSAVTVGAATNSTNVLGGVAGAVHYQSATNATGFTAAGTAGQILTSAGAGAPTWTTPSTLAVSSAGTSTNLAGGVAGGVPYQSAVGTTTVLGAGTAGQFLTSGGAGAPTWTTPSAVSVGTATNLAGGVAGAIHYQSAVGTTGFSTAGTAGQVMVSGGAGAPTWINQASLTITTVSNIAGGVAGGIPYQSAVGTTTMLGAGTAGQILTSGGAGAPTWTTPSTLTVSSAGTATNLAGGVAGAVHYQSAVGTTGFTTAGTAGQVLISAGAGAPTWATPSTLAVSSAGTATSLAGGVAGGVPYQSAVGTTTMLGAGTAGQVLTSGGAGAPTWTTVSSLTVSSATTSTNLAGAQWALPYQSALNTTAMLAAGTSGQVLTSNGAGAPSWQTPAATTATTQVYGDNSTNIATTAFVDRLRSSPTSTSTTAVIADRGKTITSTVGVTVPASVFVAGDCFSVYNNSAASITLTSGAGLTLYLVGTATTGNRTLAQRGIATVYYVSAIEAVITGGGLT
jgi:hypothetical protein